MALHGRIAGLFILSLPLSMAAAGGEYDRQTSADGLDRLIAEKELAGAVATLERRLDSHPGDPTAVDMLQLVIAGNYRVSRTETMRLRAVVRRNSYATAAVLVPPGEPGDRLIVEGRVTDSNGEPVAGAEVHVYQTDARGFYTPQDEQTGRMDEQNSRLFAFLRTGDDGRFQFRTVRPGGYPNPRRDVGPGSPLRFIPQHVHVDVAAAGFVERRIQLVFDDDPRMNAEWRDWAVKQNNPILELAERNGTLHGAVPIVLEAD